MDKRTQMTELLNLFKVRPTLSVQQINLILAINSPRKIISALREKGVPIKDRWVEEINRYGRVTHFKEYWVEKDWWQNDHVL
jgi:hypothetical protein